MGTQLSLNLTSEACGSSLVDDAEYQAHDRDWERCMWIWEILVRLPLDFVFTEREHVICVDDGVYLAMGADPHQWQEFVWIEEDEWMLGDSDLNSSISSRVDEAEFTFVLSELRLKEPMALSKLKNMRICLKKEPYFY